MTWWALVVVALGTVEWLRGPRGAVAMIVGVATLVALLTWRFTGPRPSGFSVVAALVLFVVLAGYHFRAVTTTRDWGARERSLVRAAEVHLTGWLTNQTTRLNQLSRAAARISLRSREQAFERLERMLPSAAPEVSLTILDSAGAPFAWSGPIRVTPTAGNAPLGFHLTPYYATLEVRRHHADGGTVVASALVFADRVVPGDPRTLANALRERLGADVRFMAGDTNAASFAWPAAAPVLHAEVLVGSAGDRLARTWQVAAGLAATALLVLLVTLCVGSPSVPARVGGLLLMLWAGLRAPVGEALGVEPLVTAAVYYSGVLGALSATSLALVLSGAVLMVLAVGLWSRRLAPSRLLIAVGIAVLLLTPYGIRELARGITPPSGGVSLALWWTWHLGLLFPTAALLIITASLMRTRSPDASARWPGAVASIAALVAAFIGVLVFTGRPGWPVWYTSFWVPALVLAVWPARRVVTMVGIAVVAGAGSGLMTWGASLAGRIDVAVRDVDGLGLDPDPLAEPLLGEFARQVSDAGTALTPSDLYRLWTRSAVARQAYPTRLTLWNHDGTLLEDVRLDDLALPDSVLRQAVLSVEGVGVPTVQRAFAMPGIHHLLSLHLEDEQVMTMVAGPRTALIAPTPLGRVLVGGNRSALYRLTVSAAPALRPLDAPDRWRREGWGLRMWRPVAFAGDVHEVTAVIPLGRPPWIQVRGALVVLLDLALIAGVWMFADRVWARPRQPVRWRDLARSYRARVAVALAMFCVVPAALLVGLSLTQLATESRQTGDLVLQQVLADAEPPDGFPSSSAELAESLREQAARVRAELAIYRQGRLAATSGSLLGDLGLFAPLLDARAFHSIYLDLDATAAPRPASAGGARTGYASVSSRQERLPAVLATIAPVNDRTLNDRRADLAMLLLLATIVGILAALAGARVAARSLARPVTELRDAALAFGAGTDPAPLTGDPPPEFGPVFEAFGRMASDIRASQAALLAARQRTDAVLATVATGVVAVDRSGEVLLANRQASEALGEDLRTGRPLEDALHGPWTDLHVLVSRRLQDGAEDAAQIEVETGERRYMVQLASLGGGLGGLVLAVNDVTTTSRAARVLAWAEVANQVAHAIKNPLTPLRLGIQHLRRVQATRPAELERTLDETGTRILAEIERLDAIARAFSRFAAPSEPSRPLEGVPVAEVAGEVAALYRLAPEVTVRVEVPVWVQWPARRDEFKEVLFNLFENARNAGASAITVRGSAAYIEVRDDGQGIPPDLLPRVFEPRFSTTSSGSGLGLAIVRRVAESWGVTVGIESEPGRGTVVTIRRRVDGGE